VKLSEKLQAIVVFYDASVAYFNWKNFNEVQLYEDTIKMHKFKRNTIPNQSGDKPAIDSVEAGNSS
jgi:hypothetical protein